MADEDEMLVALIDGELDEDRSRGLLARLETDAALRARYEALRDAKPPIGAAFDALIERAPLARLLAAIPPEAAARPAARRRGAIAFRELAAGFVVGLLAAGAAAWLAFGLPGGDDDDGRSAVVAYMDLYTNETFAFPAPDAETQGRELAAVGARVGVALTPQAVAAPGLEFKVAFILGYDGAPLGEIAYVDPTGEPVLLCVLAKAAPDAPIRVERRDGYSLANWARAGRNYLVIGRLPEPRISELARTLEARL